MADEVKVQDAMQSDFSVVETTLQRNYWRALILTRTVLLSTCSKLVPLILGNYSSSLAL